MDIWSWLQEVAILIVVWRITSADSGVLESLRPKVENPPDLNEFLTNFWGLKRDFSLIRKAARKYSKMKKDIQDIGLYDPTEYFSDPYNDFSNGYKVDKRHVHHNSGNRRFRNLGLLPPNMRNKFHRTRRGTQTFEEEPDGGRNKRLPEIIMLQGTDENVQKQEEKHIPSQIFADPQPEKVQKRSPQEIIVQSEGDKGRVVVHDQKRKVKKQAIDLDGEVHRTVKAHPGRTMMDMRGNKQSDNYYVDLEDAAERDKDRYSDRRLWNSPRQGYYYPPGPMYNGPRQRPRPRPNYEYPQYDNGMHHTLNDEVAFEKALSYEIEPKYGEGRENFNNPGGNNLLSVDAGRPDHIQPFYPQEGIQNGYEYAPQAATNERFFIDADKGLTRQETTQATTSTTTGNVVPGDGQKNVKRVGSGFMEITKARRDSEQELKDNENENPVLIKKSLPNRDDAVGKEEGQSDRDIDRSKEESSVLSKHSLHPLRVKDTRQDEEELDEGSDNSAHSSQERNVDEEEDSNREKREVRFRSRKLQFLDYQSSDSYNPEENYEEVPHRSRRDFLDALGMKNEEDYTEDNPYKDEENVNNTDIHNDTHIQEHVSKHHSCVSTTTWRPNAKHQKAAFKNIKQILEEPKEAAGVPTLGDLKMKKEKRPKKSVRREDYFDDDEETRRTRETIEQNKDKATDDIVRKIMQSKDEERDANEDKDRTDGVDAKAMQNKDKAREADDDVGTKIVQDKDRIEDVDTKVVQNKDKAREADDDVKIVQDKDRTDDIDAKIVQNKDEVREADDDIGTKIMQNKDKIYNAHEDHRNTNSVRQERTMEWNGEQTKWNAEASRSGKVKKHVATQHVINKKEDIVAGLTDVALDVTEPAGVAETTELKEVEVTEMKEFTEMAAVALNGSETSTAEVNAAYEQMAHHMDVENEKLAQVVNGHLATKIVSTVFDALRQRTSLKSKFYSGLSRKHVDFAGTFDCDIFKTNETNDVDEARLLLDQISRVLNKLVMNQVRRKLCQRLPDELKQYLNILLNTKNTIEAANYVQNPNQGDFLFTYQDKNEPPFDVQRLQEILVKLEGLLLSFHNMNEDSQNRASPIKDYIEKHVKMLKQIVSCPGGENCGDKFSETKRNTPILDRDLFEQQLQSVGLGKDQEFIPNFDLSQMVRNKMRSNSWKNDEKREADRFKSQQFKKLQLAVERIRDKRENEKKIAEMFGGEGRSTKKRDVGFEQPVVYSLG